MKGQITQLTKRPAMHAAMRQAKVLAQNEGLKLNDTTSVQGLHYAKTALDDQISAALRQGNNNEARVLIGTRDKLLTLMEKLSPTYAQARQEFAAASRPINTMEVANELLGKLETNNFDASGMPKIDYRGYKAALSRALRDSEYGIDPKAQGVLEAVQRDLQRATASNAVRTSGSDTAFNLQAPGWLARHFYGPNYEGPTLPLRIGGMTAGAALGAATGHPLAGLSIGTAAGFGTGALIGKAAGSRVNAEMAEAMLDPAKFLGLLRSAEAGARTAQSAVRGLLSSRGPQAASYAAARQAGNAP